ncbi:MAG: hypothetical protein HDR38_07010, partial [Treponema sp.]|nr:hypothetical protein [Treponema sp.]
MKKILKTAAAALAGMLAFGLAACTDGNDSYVPEEPTYFQKVSDESGNDLSVTAVWDFSNATAFPDNIDITTLAKIAPSSPTDGTGNAELVYRSGLAKDLGIGKVGSNQFFRVGSSTNASLTNLKDAKGSFKLTLNGQSNIQIYAYSDQNGGKPSTFVAVYKDDGSASAITERNNLPKYNDAVFTKPTLGIEGAAAGAYIIYANAASIVKIDVNAASQFYSEEAVTGIALDTSNLSVSDDGYSKELRLAREFILPNVYLADGETVNKEKIL